MILEHIKAGSKCDDGVNRSNCRMLNVSLCEKSFIINKVKQRAVHDSSQREKRDSAASICRHQTCLFISRMLRVHMRAMEFKICVHDQNEIHHTYIEAPRRSLKQSKSIHKSFPENYFLFLKNTLPLLLFYVLSDEDVS